MNDDDYKGFLVIKQTYDVRCRNCGWRGKARLGDEPILDAEAEGAEICPVCNAYALEADNGKTARPAS